MRTIVLVAITLAMATATARADWAYTKWGMTPDQVAGASKGAVQVIPLAERVTLEGSPVRTGATGVYADGAINLNVRFSFDPKTDTLNCVFYGVTSESQNAAFKDLLIKRYGPPQGSQISGVSSLTWDKPDLITLTMTEGDRSFVSQCQPRPK
jgi:hypothetical protein